MDLEIEGPSGGQNGPKIQNSGWGILFWEFQREGRDWSGSLGHSGAGGLHFLWI